MITLHITHFTFHRSIVLLFILILPCVIFAEKAEVERRIHDLEYGIPVKRKQAAEVLGELGDKSAVPYLIKATKDESPEVRCASCEALGKLGDRGAIEPLKEVLKDESPEVRCAAAEALGFLKNNTGLSILIQAIQDNTISYHRRCGVAKALGILEEPGAVPTLVSVLDDKNPILRREVIYALGKIKDKRAVEPLLERLKDESMPEIRVATTGALADIGEKTAIPQLVMKSLNDPATEVRASASKALDRLIDQRAIPMLVELIKDEDAGEYAKSKLDGLIGKDEVALILKEEWLGDSATRLYIIDRIGKLKNSNAVPTLINALGSENPVVRSTAAISLGRIGDKSSVNALIKKVDDEDIEVCESVIKALGEIGAPECDTTLIRILRTGKEWSIRVVAAQSLGKLPATTILSPIMKSLRDVDWEVRYFAAFALGELGDRRAFKALKYTGEEDTNTEVKEAARIAVAKIREKNPDVTY